MVGGGVQVMDRETRDRFLGRFLEIVFFMVDSDMPAALAQLKSSEVIAS